mmetsp:Transcript_25439/g.74912  ORF Transcript_25439/g.74912 Transcript_25439/m.74912 type:complete len:320 (-) Transcript_25439:72-1031(-)
MGPRRGSAWFTATGSSCRARRPFLPRRAVGLRTTVITPRRRHPPPLRRQDRPRSAAPQRGTPHRPNFRSWGIPAKSRRTWRRRWGAPSWRPSCSGPRGRGRDAAGAMAAKSRRGSCPRPRRLRRRSTPFCLAGSAWRWTSGSGLASRITKRGGARASPASAAARAGSPSASWGRGTPPSWSHLRRCGSGLSGTAFNPTTGSRSDGGRPARPGPSGTTRGSTSGSSAGSSLGRPRFARSSAARAPRRGGTRGGASRAARVLPAQNRSRPSASRSCSATATSRPTVSPGRATGRTAPWRASRAPGSGSKCTGMADCTSRSA